MDAPIPPDGEREIGLSMNLDSVARGFYEGFVDQISFAKGGIQIDCLFLGHVDSRSWWYSNRIFDQSSSAKTVVVVIPLPAAINFSPWISELS